MVKRSNQTTLFCIRFLLPVLAILLLSGCGLLSEPQQPVIPPPPPTVASLLAAEPGGEPVVDPVSDIVPAIDPEIAALVNAVSQQQLMVYVQTLDSFGTRNAFSATDRDDFGVGAARSWIFSEFERVGNGRLQVAFDDFTLSYSGLLAEQRNVVATLPGTGPGDAIILALAHYDNRSVSVTDGVTRAPGANDNASGVALLLETARVLSSRQWHNTIVFLAVAAEEQGTFGARHFAQNAFLDNRNILAAINYDGVGGRAGIRQAVRLFAQDLYQSPMGQLGRYYEYVGGLYLPTFPVILYNALDREGRWGDQREFVNVGIPSVRVIESEENPDLVNSLLDTWTLIDYAYLQQVTQLNVAVLANAAGAPQPPAQPIINALAEPGSYLITWPVDPAAAAYALSFRPLNSPTYPPFRFVRANRAGNVALTGLDPNETYMVSIAALHANGRLGYFSSEILVEPRSDQSATAGD